MFDPTYDQEEIAANLEWQLAFSLSEIFNDNAPVGWVKYIPTAKRLLSNYEIKRNLSGSEVLEIIDPADPASLQSFTPGVWTAKWAPPVPGGDLEILKRTPGIKIVKNEYEPENLPEWVAVQFIICA